MRKEEEEKDRRSDKVHEDRERIVGKPGGGVERGGYIGYADRRKGTS